MSDWELATPENRVITTAAPSSAEDVAARLIRALQNGDVAVVLTREELGLLTDMVEDQWDSDEEFKLLQKLVDLRKA